MGKRRRTNAHAEGTKYNLPEQKSKSRSRSTAFSPQKEQFLESLHEAFKTKLRDIIKLKLQKSSNTEKLKKEEEERNKVPPKTYESLDQEHGPYWTANRIKSFKLDALKIYKDVVKANFDQMINEVKDVIESEDKPEGSKSRPPSTDRTVVTEQVKSIVIPLGTLIRRDLPANTRAVVLDKFDSAIKQYSDFASMFSFAVELSMILFVMNGTSSPNRNQNLNSLIPPEFQNQSHDFVLPPPPTHPNSDKANLYADYKNLFSTNHLQIISTANFGTTGITKKTREDHQLWIDIQEMLFTKNSSHIPDSDSDDDFQAGPSTSKPVPASVKEECKPLFDKGKEIKASIKKAAVAQLSINLENMYLKRKKFQKALDKTLGILLKMHLQPEKERKRRKKIKYLQDNPKEPTESVKNQGFTRNKKRSLLKMYRKKIKKYKEKGKIKQEEKWTAKHDHIKKLATVKKSKNSKKARKFSQNIPSPADEDIDCLTYENNEVNISYTRLQKIKGTIKHLLYYHDGETIMKKDIDVNDATDRETQVCSQLFSFLKPFVPRKEMSYTIAAQLPLLVLSNKLFEATNYKKYTIKLCPRPKSSSLLCLPVDTALLYTLLTDFGEETFRLTCKDGVQITSNPQALKRKTETFGFIFDMDRIKDFCDSRKLSFIHRILVRPGLVSCIINGASVKDTQDNRPKVVSSKKSKIPASLSKEEQARENQEKQRKLEALTKKSKLLNDELKAEQKSFNLQQLDKEIKDLKKERNELMEYPEKRLAQKAIRQKKEERWQKFHKIETIRLKLKENRTTQYIIRNNVKLEQERSDSKLVPSFEKPDCLSSVENIDLSRLGTDLDRVRFSGTDYGMKTMSVTVPISLKTFENHMHLYNDMNPENQLPVSNVDDESKYFRLPKAHKITSSQINYLSLKNKIRHKMERKKRSTTLGKKVSAIEENLAKISLNTPSGDIQELKKQFVACMKDRSVLREFYYSKRASREKRTVELKTRQVKDSLLAKERYFVKNEIKKMVPVLCIGNKGTGVGSRIKGYDRRGGSWMRETHGRYSVAAITDEHRTSQVCVYCYSQIVHPRNKDGSVNLGTTRCLNPRCISLKAGHSSQNRDHMSALAIGLSGMTRLLLNKCLPPFTSKYYEHQ